MRTEGRDINVKLKSRVIITVSVLKIRFVKNLDKNSKYVVHCDKLNRFLCFPGWMGKIKNNVFQ